MDKQLSMGDGTKKVCRFLGELGWKYELLAEGTIKTSYSGNFGDINILVQVKKSGLNMAINPVLNQPVDGWNNSVSNLIKTLNSEANFIRIGLDKQGDVFVKVDLPAYNFQFDQFAYVMLNLCQVSEQLTVPVLQVQAFEEYEDSDSPR
ncbi:hypothetical protein JYT19_00740 [Sulfobacillus acidophilus]|uniref:YbjN domain-containing protein n=1 Tax=Sulfobacillus acidophilus TaxID=53633 RepID=A0ABS3AX71_9FIRM|nr:hypothetical protein [Sulfobacillus acidophilus]